MRAEDASMPSAAPGGTAHHEVFTDPTGRRWRTIRRLLASVVAILIVAAGAAFTAVTRTPIHRELGAGLSIRDTGRHAPVIGSGPLERVIRIDRDHGRALDPFHGQQVGWLTPQELRQTGTAPYAIQKYGYAQGIHKTISLTFDDGPDTKITPQLLDMLAQEKVPATFFVIGRYVVSNEDIVRRLVREGHAIGIHTLSHPDVSEEPDWREQLEVVGGERVLRHVAGVSAGMWRAPFAAADDLHKQMTVDGLLRAQRLGYVHATYDFDTLDWKHNAREGGSAADIPMPNLRTSDNLTVLLHDGGGPNRDRTVAYTRELIRAAKAAGYTFHTMPQVAPDLQGVNAPVRSDVIDALTYAATRAYFTWPTLLMRGLFIFALIVVAVIGLMNMVLAVRRNRRRRAIVWPAPETSGLRVSVALAAYNEEPVIERTLRSLASSSWPIAEIVVVDDGSTDNTAAVIRRVAYDDDRIVLVRKLNGGKAAALNDAVARATGDIVITLDADTVIEPDTVGHLVRHFELPGNERLGGVAGVVKVGNRTTNLLTRWQALEYITQIGIERSAQDALGAIMIIPGACAAWRREAILEAGGYSKDTLAEDCDLALTMHRLGWQVTQDDEALSYTEAPQTTDDLLAQRTRWSYGTIQALAKHRKLIFSRRHRALGWFVIPNYLLTLIVPFFFIPFTVAATLMAVQTEGVWLPARYFAIFVILQTLIAWVGIRLMREDRAHLWLVPVYRIAFEPLRAYLLYTSVAAALKGRRMGWNKLVRTGSFDESIPGTAPTAFTPITTPRARTTEEFAPC
ncbi:MAG: glycosyltransferase [Austwickia sp.]|nr:glycosyltransferase [Austwickia sp.]